ncbi:MAG: winged helix-turn-helix transcriptional regulator, partial [Candidatus Omnitrophica bacterium]|nr:winged helix-turn-helix transcriptional regulator [Candidatus Omnitrophota bacterium]MCK5493089.1 winged helix-turn-helix transcriptional regulator [Candidatus Omnitrophota bacterium]
KLSYMEFKLLRYLVFKKGDIVSRKELLLQVWGYQMEALTRTVDAHIGALRKKIGKNYITTIHGIGYSFKG